MLYKQPSVRVFQKQPPNLLCRPLLKGNLNEKAQRCPHQEADLGRQFFCSKSDEDTSLAGQLNEKIPFPSRNRKIKQLEEFPLLIWKCLLAVEDGGINSVVPVDSKALTLHKLQTPKFEYQRRNKVKLKILCFLKPESRRAPAPAAGPLRVDTFRRPPVTLRSLQKSNPFPVLIVLCPAGFSCSLKNTPFNVGATFCLKFLWQVSTGTAVPLALFPFDCFALLLEHFSKQGPCDHAPQARSSTD
ncbi:hypothetical protein Anapl_07492 [Anas platyrhynchos]|uniref:Uncharacterized protein n=1 Tax=Anas platyrhynchos TaxID=8839 RepID=R0L7W5_ANAPL|nr:hypothetical protein Anapl_07492 [Anas platyrhynchos]